MVPPVLERNPDAPLEWDPSAFCTLLTKAPTSAACIPTVAAYWSVGLGSKPPESVGGPVVDMANKTENASVGVVSESESESDNGVSGKPSDVRPGLTFLDTCRRITVCQ
jgi:hypothetical protein